MSDRPSLRDILGDARLPASTKRRPDRPPVSLEQVIEHVLARHPGWTRDEIDPRGDPAGALVFHGMLHERIGTQPTPAHDPADLTSDG